jgi:hypothetical protein
LEELVVEVGLECLEPGGISEFGEGGFSDAEGFESLVETIVIEFG